jgi:predicted ribosomally synthesized peptide with nif11-like leader
MSVDAALKFLERVEREESLRTQLYISNPIELDALAQFAHGKGFVLSSDDLKEALVVYKPQFKSGSIEPLRQLVSPK